MKEFEEFDYTQDQEESVTEEPVDTDEWSSDFGGLEENHGLGDSNFESDFSGCGNDNFETNIWDDSEDSASEDDGYWEPPEDNSYDWGDDDSSSDDDWVGGEGDGGGWGTDGGDMTDTSYEDSFDTNVDTTE